MPVVAIIRKCYQTLQIKCPGHGYTKTILDISSGGKWIVIITATVGVDVDLNMQLVKTLSFNFNRILQQSESESVIYGCRNKNW